jgi:hypothetical protein
VNSKSMRVSPLSRYVYRSVDIPKLLESVLINNNIYVV